MLKPARQALQDSFRKGPAAKILKKIQKGAPFGTPDVETLLAGHNIG
jgi:hypothetical protein